MLQYSKILRSRNEWRQKATGRATEALEFRKTQKRHQGKIAALKRRNRELEQLIANKKNG